MLIFLHFMLALNTQVAWSTGSAVSSKQDLAIYAKLGASYFTKS